MNNQNQNHNSTAHLFQTNDGIEFTIAPSNEENIPLINGDIYKGSWILKGEKVETTITSFLEIIARAKRPSEQASRLVRLMDNSFSREVA